ncbi:MAG: Dissimilatory sulfite reductase, gamma subunit DsrC [Candidatus Kapaibacterium sp.]|nr:MAG: Dissimilatory sulfite reductase, gamma subunit DsrC [Candidatus Kapabacteria bacterium]ROL57945.1 MAG: TusE/DsrC/DsvC family sulfur relay protein [Bacteroidetes/Chlorobi group bacterium Naka2016]
MPVFEWNEIKIEVDEDGFMANPDEWNERVALALASTEGITELTADHWKVINYLRDYYKQYGIAPMIRKLCKETGFTLKQIYDLFPSGPAKGACKVAGLAKPTGCV